jgi:hypothetical protein
MSKNLIQIGAALAALALPALSQYSVNGGGGIVPSSGTGGGGNPSTVLPTSFNSFPLTTPVPAAASNIRSVTIHGFNHTYSGDIQAVLWAPTMTTGYNLIVRCGLAASAGCCGFPVDYAGDYTFVPAGDPTITQSWPAVSPTAVALPAGVYPQEYGLLWGTGWVSGSNGVFNTDMASIPVVPGTWTLVIYDGAAIDVGSITSWTMSGDTGPAANVFCPGDGSGTACPCANSGAAGNGCASSVNSSGAHLATSGSASVSNDTLVLNGSGMPNSSALYFQGTAQILGGAGAVFGDGKRCVGGAVIRLGTKINAAGSSHYPAGADPLIHVKGLDAPGNVRDYQIWYRNAAPFCNPETFNLSNGVELTWGP